MSVFRFSPEGSWSINDFQRNSPPFPFPCAAVAFSLVLSLSKTPLSSFFILFLSFFGCFSTLLPFCFAFGLPLNCPYTIYLGMWQCIRKQREGAAGAGRGDGETGPRPRSQLSAAPRDPGGRAGGGIVCKYAR